MRKRHLWSRKSYPQIRFWTQTLWSDLRLQPTEVLDTRDLSHITHWCMTSPPQAEHYLIRTVFLGELKRKCVSRMEESFITRNRSEDLEGLGFSEKRLLT